MLTSKGGWCVYTVVWPVMPKAFRGAHFPYRVPCWAKSSGPCGTWEAKQEKKQPKPKQEDLLK